MLNTEGYCKMCLLYFISQHITDITFNVTGKGHLLVTVGHLSRSFELTTAGTKVTNGYTGEDS
jgi:hypothetical protein